MALPAAMPSSFSNLHHHTGHYCQGMGGAMADRNLPLFGSLKTLFDGARPFNKTIFSVIPNEELLNRTVAAVKEVAGSIEKPSAGFMFTMPVANVYSLGSEHNQE